MLAPRRVSAPLRSLQFCGGRASSPPSCQSSSNQNAGFLLNPVNPSKDYMLQWFILLSAPFAESWTWILVRSSIEIKTLKPLYSIFLIYTKDAYIAFLFQRLLDFSCIRRLVAKSIWDWGVWQNGRVVLTPAWPWSIPSRYHIFPCVLESSAQSRGCAQLINLAEFYSPSLEQSWITQITNHVA